MALRLESTCVLGASSLASRFRSSKQPSALNVAGLNKRGRKSGGAGSRLVAVRAAEEVHVREGDILPSGEWPESFSLLNYEDLSKHYEPDLFKPEAQPHKILAEVMSKIMHIAYPDQALQEVDHCFSEISGLPVVDEAYKCLGVLSRKDRSKASDLTVKVKDVMSSPAITLSVEKTVCEAAVLMLKNKVHRIPVVNDEEQVVGIVTRTDIFTAMEGGA